MVAMKATAILLLCLSISIATVTAETLRLFATSVDSSSSVLYEISGTDGSVTRTVGATGLPVESIAWHPSKATIYAAAGGSIWTIDPTTAATKLIQTLGSSCTSLGSYVWSLTFSSTSTLYASLTSSASVGNNPAIVSIDLSTGVCSTISSAVFTGGYTGLTFDDTDSLWIQRSQGLTIDNITDINNVGTGATIDGVDPGSSDGVATGLTCASNDVCYCLLGSPLYSSLTDSSNNPSSSGIGVIVRSTGVLSLLGRTGINVLRGLVAETLGVYLDAPSSATQNVARSIRVYARPAFQTPISITFISSSNHNVLTEAAVTVSAVDSSSKQIAFTSTTQGVTKLKFQAVDARGRTVTNSLSLAVLPSPKLTTPPSQVLSLVGKNSSLAITDIQQLDGVTVTATSNGDLQLWTDSTGVHWYAPTATNQTVTVNATNVYGGSSIVSFVVNPIASVPCLNL